MCEMEIISTREDKNLDDDDADIEHVCSLKQMT